MAQPPLKSFLTSSYSGGSAPSTAPNALLANLLAEQAFRRQSADAARAEASKPYSSGEKLGLAILAALSLGGALAGGNRAKILSAVGTAGLQAFPGLTRGRQREAAKSAEDQAKEAGDTLTQLAPTLLREAADSAAAQERRDTLARLYGTDADLVAVTGKEPPAAEARRAASVQSAKDEAENAAIRADAVTLFPDKKRQDQFVASAIKARRLGKETSGAELTPAQQVSLAFEKAKAVVKGRAAGEADVAETGILAAVSNSPTVRVLASGNGWKPGQAQSVVAQANAYGDKIMNATGYSMTDVGKTVTDARGPFALRRKIVQRRLLELGGTPSPESFIGRLAQSVAQKQITPSAAVDALKESGVEIQNEAGLRAELDKNPPAPVVARLLALAFQSAEDKGAFDTELDLKVRSLPGPGVDSEGE